MALGVFVSAGSPPTTLATASEFKSLFSFDSVSPMDYGAVGDGTTDDSAAIQAAIDAVEAAGGGDVHLLDKTYAIATKLVMDASNVRLIGMGGDRNHDTGTAGGQAATSLKWTGALGGVMLDIDTKSGPQAMSGNGVEGIYFNSNSLAAKGIVIRTLWGGRFRDLFGFNFSTAFIDVGVTTSLSEAEDTQHCLFQNINSRNNAAIPGGGGFILDGDTAIGANTSFNVFENCLIQVHNGTGWSLNCCDNNVFIGCRSMVIGSGTAMILEGSNSAVDDVARANIFIQYSGGAVIARGTSTYTYPSYNNRFICLDVDNGTPAPTVEAGSSAPYDRTDGVYSGIGISKLVISDGVATASSERSNLTNESLRIYNASSNHIRLTDGTNEFAINISNATGHCRITNVSGSGGMFFTASAAEPFLLGAAYVLAGTDAPEGVVTAPVGSLWLRTNGGASTTLYVKESGAGNTGWIAK